MFWIAWNWHWKFWMQIQIQFKPGSLPSPKPKMSKVVECIQCHVNPNIDQEMNIISFCNVFQIFATFFTILLLSKKQIFPPPGGLTWNRLEHVSSSSQARPEMSRTCSEPLPNLPVKYFLINIWVDVKCRRTYTGTQTQAPSIWLCECTCASLCPEHAACMGL